MKAVLLLAHGSREDATEKTLEKIVGYIKEELAPETEKEDFIIEEAYLQFRDKNLGSVLESLCERGADDIAVIPYFLFEGVHIKEDIPSEIKEFTDTHSNVRVSLGRTLGSDRRLALIAADNVRELIKT